MDGQIVLDVNLGFRNDYDELSVPESNTILSFLNRKIQARAALKKQLQAEKEESATASKTTLPQVPAVRASSAITSEESSIISCGASTKKPSAAFKTGKLHETSLLSAVSTSDDEENILPIQNIKKNEENKQVKKNRNSASNTVSRNSTTPAVPTFRFLNFRTTEENWVMYTIEITTGTEKWRFESRYSLLKVFEEKLGEEVKGEKLPDFPGKKWFGNLSDEFIKERMISIERFMNAAFRNQNVQKTKIFKEFLRQSRENCIDF